MGHLDFTQLNEYLDDEINKDKLELVRAHLFSCTQCQQELNRIKDLRTQLAKEVQALGNAPQPALGWEKRLHQSYREIYRVKPQRNISWGRPVVAALVALLLLALYLPLQNRVPLRRPSGPSVLEPIENLPSPQKEMRLFGLDQPKMPESLENRPERAVVYTSTHEEELEQVYQELQKAGLQPVRRGDEVLVEGINVQEAERLIAEITEK